MIFFSRPQLLVLLFLLPFAWRQLHNAGQRSPVYKQRRVLVTRLLLLALLTMAASGVSWRAPSQGRDIIVLIDTSHSMPPVYEQITQHMASRLGPTERLGLITFGNDVHIVRTPDQPDGMTWRLPDGEATNIEQAIRAGLGLITWERPARLLLVSDGLETTGSARDMVAVLRQAQVPLDVLVVQPLAAPEVAVDTFRLPHVVRPDEPFSAQAVITSTDTTMAKAYVFRNDLLHDEFILSLQPGGNVVTVPNLTEQHGTALYELIIEADADTWWQNNRGQAIVHTTEEAPVLLLTGNNTRDTALSLALDAQGIAVTVQPAAQAQLTIPALQPYAAVILDNVMATQLSTTHMQALLTYVQQLGGGLLIAGGDRSYGLGLYNGTPLERLSPLQATGTDSLSVPSVAVVLVIDKSGSMSEGVTETDLSKLDFAKEAVLGVVQSLTPRDLIGIVAFDSHPSWVVPLQSAQHKDWLAGQVLTIKADGGTNAFPALQDAYEALFSVQAAVKHVLLLSDGYTIGGDFESLATTARNRGVTVSTVGVGDADRDLLAQIAAWGGGRHYYTEDPHQIPFIFFSETQRLSPPQVHHRNAAVRTVTGHEFLQGLPTLWPPVAAYALTEQKEDAVVHLMTDDGYPLLASWRTGLGRVAAFTGSLSGGWAPEWLSWPSLAPFWSQLARWLMRGPSAGDMQTELQIHQGEAHLWVDAVDGSEAYRNFLDLAATIYRPDGTTDLVPLRQTGPGRYEATFAAPHTGVWTAAIEDIHNELHETPVASATVAYPPEYRARTADVDLLAHLAAVTGGTMISTLDSPLPSGPAPVAAGNVIPLWPLLLAVATLLFMLDLVWRYVPADLPPHVALQLRQLLHDIRSRWNDARTRADAVRAQRKAETERAAPDSRQQAARDAHTYLARTRQQKRDTNDRSTLRHDE